MPARLYPSQQFVLGDASSRHQIEAVRKRNRQIHAAHADAPGAGPIQAVPPVAVGRR